MVLIWVVVICFGGLWVGQCDVVHLWGSLGAYLGGIPLLGSPGIPLHAPGLYQHGTPSHLTWMGRRGLDGHHWVACISC